MAISGCMKKKGYLSVNPAISAEEALELINNNKPDIVLLDISLQEDIDGILFAEHVTNKFNTDIVFVTGHHDSVIRQRALQLKPIGYYIKPVNCDTLHQDIQAFYANNHSSG